MDTVVATEDQILQFRQRVLAGEQLSEEELRSAYEAFRAKRRTAAEQSAKSKSRAGPARSTEELAGLFKQPAVTNGASQ